MHVSFFEPVCQHLTKHMDHETQVADEDVETDALQPSNGDVLDMQQDAAARSGLLQKRPALAAMRASRRWATHMWLDTDT